MIQQPKYHRMKPLLFLLALTAILPHRGIAQDSMIQARRSPQKAFALNLLLPGLGQRYVQGGHWHGAATVYALADAGLWIGLLTAQNRYDNLVTHYTTFAAVHADAFVEGKNRQFFLNLAAYQSSDEYLNVQLRNRNWTELGYVADRAFQWEWETEGDFFSYRQMREDSESLRRRRTLLISVLVVNRLISGFAAIRAANKINNPPSRYSVALAPPLPTGQYPRLLMYVRL